MDVVAMTDVTFLGEWLGMVRLSAFRACSPDAASCGAVTTFTVLSS